MTRDQFFQRLWDMVQDTDVDYEELMDDDGEGGVYVKFTNVVGYDDEELEEETLL